ncbi:hypothetical protein Vretimale_12630 [Volvox reticuliferus]|uniref:Uncharacterized protein n=1 Tax=Volvox reticuliferus TaxID=1737510 RepID=A0A8J4GIQ9_9CHLO|nr:hypothetical protein Vretimale_12630 [Volvox reticuliferus]
MSGPAAAPKPWICPLLTRAAPVFHDDNDDDDLEAVAAFARGESGTERPLAPAIKRLEIQSLRRTRVATWAHQTRTHTTKTPVAVAVAVAVAAHGEGTVARTNH